MKVKATIRALSASECDRVGGGIDFHPLPGPKIPEPPVPPIIVISPISKPIPGPIPSPYSGPIIGPFPVH